MHSLLVDIRVLCALLEVPFCHVFREANDVGCGDSSVKCRVDSASIYHAVADHSLCFVFVVLWIYVGI